MVSALQHAASLALALTLASASCFDSNGTLVNSTQYTPCNENSGAVSMCCGLNRTEPFGGNAQYGTTREICMTNGLCMNAFYRSDVQDGKPVYSYWRETCSASNWKGCLDNVCKDPVSGSCP